jgi:hypothetical protein
VDVAAKYPFQHYSDADFIPAICKAHMVEKLPSSGIEVSSHSAWIYAADWDTDRHHAIYVKYKWTLPKIYPNMLPRFLHSYRRKELP